MEGRRPVTGTITGRMAQLDVRPSADIIGGAINHYQEEGDNAKQYND